MEHSFYPKRCTSSLAETVANIDELLTEILMRVPARPLVRFKCVSKHWLSLISDPRFCCLHTLQNPNPPISAVFAETSLQPFGFIPLSRISSSTSSHEHPSPGSPPFNPLKFAQNQYPGDIRIIQSCNGLFLCCLFEPQCDVFVCFTSIKKTDPPYFVLNPTTNQFSTVIPPPITVTTTGEQVESYIISIALAFDPSKSPYYKLICLRTLDGTKKCKFYQILIYSSQTQTWRLLDSNFYKVYTVRYGRGLYWNGAINWFGEYGEVEYFHVDEERGGFVGNRPYLYEKRKYTRTERYFGESGDGRHLHFIETYRQCLPKFEVLEMGRDYSGWFVKYKVDFEPFLAALPHFLYGRFIVLFLDREENEEDESSSLLLHTYNGKLISYNLKSTVFRTHELTPKAEGDGSGFRVQAANFRYVETGEFGLCVIYSLYPLADAVWFLLLVVRSLS